MKIENCFNLSYSPGNDGYFYFPWDNTSTKIYLSKEELVESMNKVNSILSNNGNGKIGKTLYVGKGSNVPRHKIKMFIEENKIKKTTIIENSDTVIFDKKVIKDVYQWFANSRPVKIAIIPFTTEIMANILRINQLQAKSAYVKDQLSDFLKKKSYMIINYGEYIEYDYGMQRSIGNVEWIDCYKQDNYRVKNIQDVYDTIEYYMSNPHGNIIWDDVILETLNSDGIELNGEYINTLNSMFSSGEPDNIKLAIELLSNVDLEKYGLTVALLLNKWSYIMGWGNGNTDSQAYKVLDRYFKNKEIDWKKDYRSFSAGLYKNYCSNENYKEIVSKFVLDNINDYLSSGVDKANKNSVYLQIDNFNISLHTVK
jgi:hypothetical protein